MGFKGYDRWFSEVFASTIKPMTILTRHGVPFHRYSNYEVSFLKLMDLLIEARFLTIIVVEKGFTI